MKNLALLVLAATFTFTFATSARADEDRYSWKDRAGQCVGGAAVVGVLVGVPAAAVTYAVDGPRAALNVAGVASAAGCGLTMLGANLDPANAAPAEQDLRIQENQINDSQE